MKAKNIKSVLRNKFNDWAASITDSATKELVMRDGLITGGSIASMLMGEPVNDFDIYLETKEAAIAIAEYYVTQFEKGKPGCFRDGARVSEDNGIIKIMVKLDQIPGDPEQDEVEFAMEAAKVVKESVDKSKPKYRPVFLSANAISLSDDIQIVIRFYGPVEDIHANYDFIHCTCSWKASNGELRLPPAALESMLAKDLRYKSSKYPLCSIIRTRKFLARGWKISAGQYVKMAWELNQLDLTDIRVLEDQMVGVDSAYFVQVISMLKERATDKIDGAFLMEVIDRVF